MTSLNFFLFSNIKPTLWLEPTEQQVEKRKNSYINVLSHTMSGGKRRNGKKIPASAH